MAEVLLAGVIDEYPGPLMSGDDGYDSGGDNTAQAMAQAHVYRQITGRSYLELELHLRNAPVICETLGLDRVVDRTSFSKSWRSQFGHRQEYLEEYCKWIIDELREIGINEFDPYLPANKERAPEPLPEIPDGEIDETIRHVRDIILGETDFGRKPNKTYSAGEILDVATNACRERGEFNAVIDDHDPTLKTVMNAIKKRDGAEWQDEFLTINDRVLDAAKGAGMLDRPVEGNLDSTIIPIFPQNLPRPDNARGNEKKRGTMHGFHFTALVVHDQEHDKDLVVGMTAYTPDMGPYDLVTELVEQAERHCTLKRLQMDSDFATVRIIQYLKEKGIDVTTRLKRRGDRIKGALAAMTGEYDEHEDYRLKSSTHNTSVSVRMVAEPDWNNADEETLQREIENNQHTFDDFGDSPTEIPDIEDVPAEMWQCRRPYATTIEDESPRQVLKKYNMRWRVENSFADKKRALLGKTQSRHHGVRVFLFWLTTIIYNGWMLARTFLRLDHPNHRPRDRPPVKARDFIKKILKLEYG